MLLRAFLLLGGFFFVLWGWLELDSVDTIIWNFLFCLINAVHLGLLIYARRPVTFDSDELEAVYQRVFGPDHYNLPRLDFKAMCEEGYVRTLPAGSSYVDAGGRAHYLSILISGHLGVVSPPDGAGRVMTLGAIREFDFIDSPQWVARNTEHGDTFNVTIRAVTDCRYLMWPRENLNKLFAARPHLSACIDSVVGTDLAGKLFRLDKAVMEQHAAQHAEADAHAKIPTGAAAAAIYESDQEDTAGSDAHSVEERRAKGQVLALCSGVSADDIQAGSPRARKRREERLQHRRSRREQVAKRVQQRAEQQAKVLRERSSNSEVAIDVDKDTEHPVSVEMVAVGDADREHDGESLPAHSTVSGRDVIQHFIELGKRGSGSDAELEQGDTQRKEDMVMSVQELYEHLLELPDQILALHERVSEDVAVLHAVMTRHLADETDRIGQEVTRVIGRIDALEQARVSLLRNLASARLPRRGRRPPDQQQASHT